MTEYLNDDPFTSTESSCCCTSDGYEADYSGFEESDDPAPSYEPTPVYGEPAVYEPAPVHDVTPLYEPATFDSAPNTFDAGADLEPITMHTGGAFASTPDPNPTFAPTVMTTGGAFASTDAPSPFATVMNMQGAYSTYGGPGSPTFSSGYFHDLPGGDIVPSPSGLPSSILDSQKHMTDILVNHSRSDMEAKYGRPISLGEWYGMGIPGSSSTGIPGL